MQPQTQKTIVTLGINQNSGDKQKAVGRGFTHNFSRFNKCPNSVGIWPVIWFLLSVLCKRKQRHAGLFVGCQMASLFCFSPCTPVARQPGQPQSGSIHQCGTSAGGNCLVMAKQLSGLRWPFADGKSRKANNSQLYTQKHGVGVWLIVATAMGRNVRHKYTTHVVAAFTLQ